MSLQPPDEPEDGGRGRPRTDRPDPGADLRHSVRELVQLVRALAAEAAALEGEVRAPGGQPTEAAINKLQALVGELELANLLARRVASDLQRHITLPGVSCGSREEHLSAREREVLRMLARGTTVSEIAKRAGLSVKTVSTYRARILHKMGFSTTAELVRYGIRHRIDN